MQRLARSEDEKARDRGKVLRRLLGYMRRYWLAVVGALVLTLVSAGSQAAGPFLIGRAVDEFIGAGDKTGLAWTMLALVGVYLAGMLAMRFQIYSRSEYPAACCVGSKL